MAKDEKMIVIDMKAMMRDLFCRLYEPDVWQIPKESSSELSLQ
jgi:hypothetical protein